mgnify:CR=1 FL=1
MPLTVPLPSLTAAEIATATGGRLVGDGWVSVRAIASLDRAGSDDLSFLGSARYAALMADSRAGVVLVSPELHDLPGPCKARIVVVNPHDALVSLIPRFYRPVAHPTGIHPEARIGRNVLMGDDVCIAAGAVVEDDAVIGNRTWIATHTVVGAGARIGDDCLVYPQVTIYPNTQVGHRVILHSGVRLGSDGFGYLQKMIDGQLTHVKIPHVGRAIIGDDVEIGVNSVVDRGSVDDTVIGAGTKIDNLVHIAHNVRVGKACLILTQVGIAGSARIEDGVVLAGQAGVSGHVTIGAGSRLAGQSGAISDVPAGETWSGYPARPHREALRASAALLKLPALMRRLERLLERAQL